MEKKRKVKNDVSKELTLFKSPTGISGFDKITAGGLPKGRSTLLIGSPGSGKTFFSMEFLCRGAEQYNEPGLYISFEESRSNLLRNFSTTEFPLKNLISKKLIILDNLEINYHDFHDVKGYSLEGLFIKLEYNIKKYKIKRIVIDSIDSLIHKINSKNVALAVTHRLVTWLNEKGVTAIFIEGKYEKEHKSNTVEEFIVDCVIQLNNPVTDRLSVRLLRIIKYRGSKHGVNEYSFLLTSNGIYLYPADYLQLEYKVNDNFQSSGVKGLNNLLDNKGFRQGSCVLYSGPSGAGKTTFLSAFADSICRSGNKCIFFSFDKSPNQIIEDTRHINIKLEKWVKNKRLMIFSSGIYTASLEEHLLNMIKMVESIQPSAVIIDTITIFKLISSSNETRIMLFKFSNFLKCHNITAAYSASTTKISDLKQEENMSSIIDGWINLRFSESAFERNRIISILKYSGINHSNKFMKFVFEKKGIKFIEIDPNEQNILLGLPHILRASDNFQYDSIAAEKNHINKKKKYEK